MSNYKKRPSWEETIPPKADSPPIPRPFIEDVSTIHDHGAEALVFSQSRPLDQTLNAHFFSSKNESAFMAETQSPGSGALTNKSWRMPSLNQGGSRISPNTGPESLIKIRIPSVHNRRSAKKSQKAAPGRKSMNDYQRYQNLKVATGSNPLKNRVPNNLDFVTDFQPQTAEHQDFDTLIGSGNQQFIIYTGGGNTTAMIASRNVGSPKSQTNQTQTDIQDPLEKKKTAHQRIQSAAVKTATSGRSLTALLKKSQAKLGHSRPGISTLKDHYSVHVHDHFQSTTGTRPLTGGGKRPRTRTRTHMNMVTQQNESEKELRKYRVAKNLQSQTYLGQSYLKTLRQQMIEKRQHKSGEETDFNNFYLTKRLGESSVEGIGGTNDDYDPLQPLIMADGLHVRMKSQGKIGLGGGEQQQSTGVIKGGSSITSQSRVRPKLKFDPSSFMRNVKNLTAGSQMSKLSQMSLISKTIEEYIQHRQQHRSTLKQGGEPYEAFEDIKKNFMTFEQSRDALNSRYANLRINSAHYDVSPTPQNLMTFSGVQESTRELGDNLRSTILREEKSSEKRLERPKTQNAKIDQLTLRHQSKSRQSQNQQQKTVPRFLQKSPTHKEVITSPLGFEPSRFRTRAEKEKYEQHRQSRNLRPFKQMSRPKGQSKERIMTDESLTVQEHKTKFATILQQPSRTKSPNLDMTSQQSIDQPHGIVLSSGGLQTFPGGELEGFGERQGTSMQIANQEVLDSLQLVEEENQAHNLSEKMRLEFQHIKSPKQRWLMQKYKPEQFIQQANTNIQKLIAELRHHVLTSENNRRIKKDLKAAQSKFIDLELGKPFDIELIGDGKVIKEDDLTLKNVPILLRLKDCKLDDTYQIHIKQVSKEQLSMIKKMNTSVHRGPRFSRISQRKFSRIDILQELTQKKRKAEHKVVMARCADLDIYISNRFQSPSRFLCDKAAFHNSVKDKSRITQISFLNKDYSEDPQANQENQELQEIMNQLGIASMLRKSTKSDKDEPAKPKGYDPLNEQASLRNIYLSISSKMGCLARITISRKVRPEDQHTLSRNNDLRGGTDSNTTSCSDLMRLDVKQRMKKMTKEDVVAELNSFAHENESVTKAKPRFSAQQRHFRNLDEHNYSAVGKYAGIIERSLVRQVLRDVTKIKKKEVDNHDRDKFEFLMNQWENYRSNMEASRELLLEAYKKKFRTRRFLILMKLSKVRGKVQALMSHQRVTNLYKRTGLFLALKVWMIQIRRKRKYGYTIEKRLTNGQIKPRVTLLFRCMQNQFEERAMEIVLQKLEDVHAQNELFTRMTKVHHSVQLIQRSRAMQNLGRIIRIKYLHQYFDRERQFIANYYLKIGSRSGKIIYSKMMGISTETVEETIYFYLLMKYKDYMIRFYEEQIEILQNRIAFERLAYSQCQTQLIKATNPAKTNPMKKRKSGMRRSSRLVSVGSLRGQKMVSSLQSSTNMGKTTSGENTHARQAEARMSVNVSSSLNSRKSATEEKSSNASRMPSLAYLQEEERLRKAQMAKLEMAIIQDQERLNDYQSKRFKLTKDLQLIDSHLFSGTDAYIRADQSVKASLRQVQEDLERKYQGQRINFKDLARQFSRVSLKQQTPQTNSPTKKGAIETTSDDSSFDTSITSSIPNQSSEEKTSTANSKDSNNKKKRKSRSRTRKSTNEVTRESLIMTGPRFGGGGEREKPKKGPFNLAAKREEIHRMIFKCCSYNPENAKKLWIQLQAGQKRAKKKKRIFSGMSRGMTTSGDSEQVIEAEGEGEDEGESQLIEGEEEEESTGSLTTEEEESGSPL